MSTIDYTKIEEFRSLSTTESKQKLADYALSEFNVTLSKSRSFDNMIKDLETALVPTEPQKTSLMSTFAATGLFTTIKDNSPADNTSVNTVKITITEDDAPVFGKLITFTVDKGVVTSADPIATDVNGEATISVKSDEAGVVTITAKDGETLLGTTTVTFTEVVTEPEPTDLSVRQTISVYKVDGKKYGFYPLRLDMYDAIVKLFKEYGTEWSTKVDEVEDSIKADIQALVQQLDGVEFITIQDSRNGYLTKITKTTMEVNSLFGL